MLVNYMYLCSVKGTYEEPKLLLRWLFPRHEVAEKANGVQHHKGAKTHSSIQLGATKAFECVDDDKVRRSTGVDTRYAHHCRHLAGADGDGGTGHERSDGNQRDKLHDPPEPSETNEQQNGASNDRKCPGNICRFDLWLCFLDLGDNVADNGAHHSNGTDGDILGGSESPVENESNKPFPQKA